MLALQEGWATVTTARDRQRGRRSEMALVFVAGFAVGAAVATAVILVMCSVESCRDDPLMHLLDQDGGDRDGR